MDKDTFFFRFTVYYYKYIIFLIIIIKQKQVGKEVQLLHCLHIIFYVCLWSASHDVVHPYLPPPNKPRRTYLHACVRVVLTVLCRPQLSRLKQELAQVKQELQYKEMGVETLQE